MSDALGGSNPSGGSQASVGSTQPFEAILKSLKKVADKLPAKDLAKAEEKILKEVDAPVLKRKIHEAFERLKAGKPDQGAAPCLT